MNNVFIAEKAGYIKVMNGWVGTPQTVVLDISNKARAQARHARARCAAARCMWALALAHAL